MSRYALEWAKRQDAGTPAAKAVLLVLADRASGRSHTCHYSDEELALHAGTAITDLIGITGSIETLGLLQQTETRPDHRQTGRHMRYELKVHVTWRIIESPKAPTRPERPDGLPAAVYRLYSATGDLLYVGIADNPEARFKGHERKQFWWREVVTREVTWYPGRAEAEAEEERAITFDEPRYNIDGTTRGGITRDSAKARRYATTGGRYAQFERAVEALKEDVARQRFPGGVMPPKQELAERYAVDEMTIEQVQHFLLENGYLSATDGMAIWRYRGWWRA